MKINGIEWCACSDTAGGEGVCGGQRKYCFVLVLEESFSGQLFHWDLRAFIQLIFPFAACTI